MGSLPPEPLPPADGEAGTTSSRNTGMLEVTGCGSTAAGMTTPAAASRSATCTGATRSPTVA